MKSKIVRSTSNAYTITNIYTSNEKEDSQIKDLTDVYQFTKELNIVTTIPKHIINNSVYDNNIDRNIYFIRGNTII